MIENEEKLKQELEKLQRELAKAQEHISQLELKNNALTQKCDEIKIQSNLFRTLGLTNDEMISHAEVGSLYMDFISTHKLSWHQLDVNTLILFLDLFQRHAEIFADIISQKNSKINIKKTVLENSKREMEKVNQIRENREVVTKKKEQRDRQVANKVEDYIESLMKEKYSRSEALEILKSDEFKAIRGMVKTLNCTYHQALEMVNASKMAMMAKKNNGEAKL